MPTDTISYILTVDIYTGELDTLLKLEAHFEAPNWHPDGYLILNSYGKLYSLDLATKELRQFDTGFTSRCNNDHGISPDAKWLAISHDDVHNPSPKSYKSAIFIMPIAGGEPRLLTPLVPSYWHGWSPDGKMVVYCAERNGEYDVYAIAIDGGDEIRLTDATGLDDGPEYSPDGRYIYFNSFRTGHMHIWRMRPDGSSPEQLTFDRYSNWFPHPSPDGKWIVYLAYMTDEGESHPFGRQVKLRLMDPLTKAVRNLTPSFFGGQGTINVPSWSPDSRKVAFVSFQLVPSSSKD